MIRRTTRLLALAAALIGFAGRASAQIIAHDEFDGVARSGFKRPGLGEWAIAGAVEKEGVLLTTGGNDHRELAAFVDSGIVWYAVTLRVKAPIVGYATVAPSESASGQFSELGFNSAYGSTEGLWTSSRGIVRSGIACTELQTFLARYDFDRHLWSAWAARGDGRSLLDEKGAVTAAPLVRDAELRQPGIGWLYLSKGSPQLLEIDRVALARTAIEALGPPNPGASPAAAPVPEPVHDPVPVPDPAVTTISFFGDSITWQGGYVDLLAAKLAANDSDRPDRPDRSGRRFELLTRGINGGKSTDLRDGCENLYGCTQKPLAQVVKEDRAAVAVIFIGINDVWHGEKGNAPDVYRAALVDLVRAAQAAGCAVVVATPTVIGEKPRGRNEFDPKLDEYAQIALAVAEELGATPCDLRGAFFSALAARNPEGRESGLLTYDRVHMTADGNELIARELERALDSATGASPPASELRPPELPLIPWPKQLWHGEGELALSGLVVATRPSLKPAAEALAGELARLGRPFQASDRRGGDGDVVLEIDPSLAGEAMRLDAARHVAVGAAGPRQVALAAATLLQLVRRGEGDVLAVPRLSIRDEPECEYRGLLLDVARQPHSLATLEQIVELCRLYKIAFLQLHLTDDQAFTFPSTAFPKLPTPGRSYSIDELRRLEAFSQARGVTIVPEIDMPGHCGAAIAAMPELFRASEKHHATINFASAKVVAAMEKLVDEALELFPATPWFHLGGDECDLAHVMENPDFRAACAREKVADAHSLYCAFLGRMNEFVKRRGRRTLVWEGFGHDSRPALPRDVTVMVYEAAYHAPDCLVRDGYGVINASWEPLYVVNDRHWPTQEIYAWDRFRWKHFLEGFPAYRGLVVERTAASAALVKGGQLCSWEQPELIELPSLRQRAAALAERLWNPGAGRGFEDFSARLAATDRRLGELLAAGR